MRMKTILAAALLLPMAAKAEPVEPRNHSFIAPAVGAMVIDGGALVVAGGAFGRRETFEFLAMPDGTHQMASIITAADGRYRVQGRYWYDADWNSVATEGLGVAEGKPFEVRMAYGNPRAIIEEIHGGAKTVTSPACDPDCFLNMSPTAVAMFVMTRQYDFEAGGKQPFRWVGRDLDQPRVLDGGLATLEYHGDVEAERANGERVSVRHFTFLEDLPTPDGGRFYLWFNLWTDDEHRPIGFDIGADSRRVYGLREGWETLFFSLERMNRPE